MTDTVKEIIFCVSGSLFFAVTMKAPKGTFKYIFAGAMITASCERILSGFYGDLIACLTATLCLMFFCELISRKIKIPATVILMPSVIPLLPGSSIYYTMLFAINEESEKAAIYAKSTLFAGLGISLGIVSGEIIIKLFGKKTR